ncbi:hypothetical protein J0J19_23210, partial [Vibrio vulnificus]|uniref:hypothetical protein n=1 Tax=Vibrio vulnificus TaxID=672 RepID=UPI0019D4A4C2
MVFKMFLRSQIGNGRETLIWGEKWVPTLSGLALGGSPPANLDYVSVFHLFDRSGTAWDDAKLNQACLHS